MTTKQLLKPELGLPFLFDEFLKPWNDIFDNNRFWGKTITVPPLNVMENANDFKVSLLAPGMEKEDFTIDLSGNMLTISAHKEEKIKDEKENYTRREYNYSSFTRSFVLPEVVKQEAIEATYKDGELVILLPKKEEARKEVVIKNINVK